jgi:hypothetical protein
VGSGYKPSIEAHIIDHLFYYHSSGLSKRELNDYIRSSINGAGHQPS